MADAQAQFTLNFNADFSAINDSTASLQKMREQILGGESALAGLQKSINNLKGVGEVARFQKIAGDIKGADSEVARLQKRLGELKGKGLEAPEAKRGAIFAEALKVDSELQKAQARAAGLRKEMSQLEANKSVQQFKQLNKAADDTRNKLGLLQTKFNAAGGSLRDVAKPTALEGLGNAAKLTGQEVGSLKDKFSALTNLGVAGWTALAVAGFAALAVAVVAAYVAVGVILVKLAAFGVECSDAARSARLLREAVTGGGESLTAVDAAIARVRANVPGTRAEIQGLALDMHKLGLRGNEVVAGTEAIQLANKVLGEQVGGVFKGLIERSKIGKRFTVNPIDLLGTGLQWKELTAATARRMGITIGAADQALRNGQIKLGNGVEALNYALQAKFGKFGRGLLLALPEQFDRLKENVGTLFSGLDIEPFLTGLKDVLSIFDETTATGRELKKLVTTIFQPMIDNATAALPKLEDLLVDFIVKAATWLADLIETGALDLFFSDAQASAEELYGTMKNIAEAVNNIAKGVNFVARGLGTKSDKSELDALNERKAKMFAIEQVGGDVKAAESGKLLVAGVVEGVKSGTPSFIQAMIDLHKAGMATFKGPQGIHAQSPSRKYREESRWIPRGAALGVEDEAPLVEQAVADMGSPDAMGARSVVEVKGARGGNGVVIEQLIVNYSGNGSREEIEEFADTLIDVLEKRVAAQGG